MLEDDAFAVDQIIDQLDNSFHADWRQTGGVNAVHFVKLYHPNDLRKIPALPNLMAIGIFIYYVLLRWKTFRYSNCITLPAAILYAGFIVSPTDPFALLRAYVSPNSVYLTMTESCCSPAVLYVHAATAPIVNYLSKSKSYSGRAVDHLLDEWTGGDVMQTDVNLVQHIGRISSKTYTA
jgi:hypothetical protein